MTLNWNEASKTLTCIPNGIPKEYTFYRMEQWLNNQTIRQFPLDILGNEGTYRFIDYSYQDTGIYKCTANNGIKSDGKLNKTTSRFLLFEGTNELYTNYRSFPYLSGYLICVKILIFSDLPKTFIESRYFFYFIIWYYTSYFRF